MATQRTKMKRVLKKGNKKSRTHKNDAIKGQTEEKRATGHGQRSGSIGESDGKTEDKKKRYSNNGIKDLEGKPNHERRRRKRKTNK